MSDARLIIRPVFPTDLPNLIDLYSHLSPTDAPIDPITAETRLSEIAAIPFSHVFGGWYQGVLATSCTLFSLPNLSRGGKPYALIENVVTHADHRQRGYGRAVLQHATQHAFDQGCYKVMLLTGVSAPETLAFYQSAGFEQTKTGFQIRNIPARKD